MPLELKHVEPDGAVVPMKMMKTTLLILQPTTMIQYMMKVILNGNVYLNFHLQTVKLILKILTGIPDYYVSYPFLYIQSEEENSDNIML